jgi:hypothetical protein
MEPQFATQRERAAGVREPRARQPAVMPVHDLAPARDIEANDRGAALRVPHEHAVGVLLVVRVRQQRRVGRGDAGQPVVGERGVRTALVEVTAAVEPERRLRERE